LRKRAFQLAGFSAALLLAAWLFRAPLLTGLADAWIVTDPRLDKTRFEGNSA
jgi:hypothetical protein